jgi:hypothetical protein
MPAPPPKTYPPLKLLTQKCYPNGPDPSYRLRQTFSALGIELLKTRPSHLSIRLIFAELRQNSNQR